MKRNIKLIVKLLLTVPVVQSKLHLMKLVLKLLITAAALLVAAYTIPGIVVESVYIAIVAAIVLGLLHLIVKPVLFVLTLPINILTLGLFSFVLNALLFWFAASFIEGFSVSGFIPALLGSLIVAVISAFGNKIMD